MWKKRKSILAITVVAVLVIGFALGNLVGTISASPGEPESIPSVINYQGTLHNPDTGYPVADGDYTFVFSIYEDETDGVFLWQETQTVSVSGGLFSVLLGSVNPLNDDLFSDSVRYLGVKVDDNEEMIPRQLLSSVPYAFQAENAKNYEETDPTVDENVKDGVDWSELSGIPDDIADGDQTTQLGTWESKDTGTVYQAPTDGFVLADVWGPPGATLILNGYTDGSNPPTTVRTRAHGSSPMAVSLTMPVRKGDYWKLESGGHNDQVWWIGFGN
ncbi:hypothetical protein ACFLV5_02080 [Chloroflexota bacterium]